MYLLRPLLKCGLNPNLSFKGEWKEVEEKEENHAPCKLDVKNFEL